MMQQNMVPKNVSRWLRPTYFTSPFLECSRLSLSNAAPSGSHGITPAVALSSTLARFIVSYNGLIAFREDVKQWKGSDCQKNGAAKAAASGVKSASLVLTANEVFEYFKILPESFYATFQCKNKIVDDDSKLIDASELKTLTMVESEELSKRSLDERQKPLVALVGSISLSNPFLSLDSIDAPSSEHLPSEETQPKCHDQFFVSPNVSSVEKWSDSMWFFSLDISHLPLNCIPFPKTVTFENLRQAVSSYNICETEAALLSRCRGLALWHRNNPFCGKCGHFMAVQDYGSCRRCMDSTCKSAIFPRQDPAVIALVSNGEFCLLGRRVGWTTSMYSTLAGFVEIGESLEQTVYREIFEETNVRVDLTSVKYITSQPWLFPQSLMVGFLVETIPTCSLEMQAGASESRAVDYTKLSSYGGSFTDPSGKEVVLPTVYCHDGELQDCKWFHYKYVSNLIHSNSSEPEIKLPEKFTIARLLIEEWLKKFDN